MNTNSEFGLRIVLAALTYAYDAAGRRTAAGGSLAAVTLPSNVTANLLTGLGIDEYFKRTDASGIDTSYTYQPFGATTVSGTSANPYQFTGRENDGAAFFTTRKRTGQNGSTLVCWMGL